MSEDTQDIAVDYETPGMAPEDVGGEAAHEDTGAPMMMI